MRNLLRKLESFLFPAESDHWLGILRIGIAVQVIFYGLSLGADWNDLFSLDSAGFVKRDLAEAVLSAKSHFIPRMGWLIDAGAILGMSEQRVLNLIWWALVLAGLCLLAGFFARAAAIVAFVLHLCAVKSTEALAYGVDNFTSIGLFYLMLAPLPGAWAVDNWKRTKDSDLLGFYRRVLQLHLCLIYFFGGIVKCAGVGWWDGTSIWRALMRPPFNAIPPEWLIMAKSGFPLLGISVCVLETAYPFFIWRKKTRFFWIAAILAMHVGIGLSMGLYLFALVMITFNLAAFGPGWAFDLRFKKNPIRIFSFREAT